jgi:tetratricopeptide (TPR) repeat protein/predicted Ser/Thr protein kinase
VEGDLNAAEIARISEHLDGCDECRTLIGLVQPIALDDDHEADCVGRYVLRRVLGRGGMGVVYEAVDPDLQRVVALKVLRPGLEDVQQRLLGEAEAMAKLSHPNVVTIFDVGRTKDRVFIVMELVQGGSLRPWLARERQPLHAVLDVFTQAGEGLAAAHEAGLVHRDFKPENVFISDDRRVRVGDFGLAVSCGMATTAGEGSAGYMAPEQRNGQQVDARSDQYSFCVALGEAVKASKARAPRWLLNAVSRGTKENPSDRFPTMVALLAALQAGRRRARLWKIGVPTAVGVGAAIAGFVLWAGHGGSPTPALCHVGDVSLTVVWSPEVAKRVERAFRESGSPIGEGTWRRTDRVLGQYAKDWESARRRICEEGSGVRGEDAVVLLDRKADCLSDRLGILRAVVAGLENADAPTLEKAPAMLQLLPRVSACEDINQIAQLAPPPPAEKRASVDAVRSKLAEASATIASGRYPAGLAGAKGAWEEANATGYFPVMAEAYLWVGIAHGRLGNTRESGEAFEQAVSAATAGQARAIAVRAWIELMHFVGFEGKRYDDGYRYAEYAKAALEAMPGAIELEVERLAWLRAMLLDQKRYEEALVASQQELTLVERRLEGSEHRLAVALDGRAGVLSGQCKARDALEPQERACEILEAQLGDPHPQLALCLGNLAGLHAKLGDHGRALPIKQRALSMFALLPGHPNHVGMAHRNMVRSLIALGRIEEAKAELQSAIPLSASPSAMVAVTVLRGEIHLREGKASAAIEDFSSAVDKTQSASASRQLEPLLLLAKANMALGRFVEAANISRRATQAARAAFGENSCQVAEPLRSEAEALIESGRPEQALPIAEAALLALAETQIDPLVRAHVEFAVARALPDTERKRARRLTKSAFEVSLRDPGEATFAAQLQRWLEAIP